MRIKTRLILVISILVLSISVVGGLATWSLYDNIKDNNNLNKLMKMQTISKHIQFRMAGLSNDERALLITGNQPFAEQMVEKSDDILVQFEKLSELSSTPSDKEAIEKVKQDYGLFWTQSQSVLKTYLENPDQATEIHFGEERRIRKEVLDPSFEGFIEKLDTETAFASESIKNQSEVRQIIVVAITVLATIVGLVLGALLLRAVLIPIYQLKNQMNDISNGNGDLTRSIDVKNNDELGEVASSFNRFLSSLRAIITQISDSSQQAAASSQQFSASAEQTKLSSNQIADNLRNISSSMNHQSKTLDESSTAVGESLQRLLGMTASTAAVAVATGVVSEQADNGEKSVEGIVASMKYIDQSVGQADANINLLAEDAMKIGEITTVITKIADQTNLLALNAAIEAARAGEHGKGFAVVAEEVRLLADHSSQSANQIRELINRMQGTTSDTVHTIKVVKDNVDNGNSLTAATAVQFQEILNSISDVTEKIQDIASTTEQLTDDFKLVTEKYEDISRLSEVNSRNTTEIAAASEEQLASMEEIQSASHSLITISESLNDMVNRFKI